jgi:hypothetical protein
MTLELRGMRRLQDLGGVETIVHLVDERLKVGGQALGQGWDRVG